MLLDKLSSRMKWFIGGGCVLLVVAFVTILAVAFAGGREAPPPIAQGDSDDALRYLASRDFAAQPAAVREAYVRQAKDAGLFAKAKGPDSPLSEDERRQLGENVKIVTRDYSDKRMDEYFDLPPEQRDRYLDKLIDEVQSKRREHTDKEGATKPGGEKNSSPAEGLKRALEGTTAEERSRILEFKRDWMDRCRQRGIEPW
jgi:hypothetical protein